MDVYFDKLSSVDLVDGSIVNELSVAMLNRSVLAIHGRSFRAVTGVDGPGCLREVRRPRHDGHDWHQTTLGDMTVA